MSEQSLFERIGGREAVEAVVGSFYEAVAGEMSLRVLYPEDLTPSREKLEYFFEQWLGGEPRYSERYGHPRLRRRHFPFVIAEHHAQLWLKHMRSALELQQIEREDFDSIWGRLESLANHMVNAHEEVPREPLPEDAWLT
ncbi:MAG: globin [Dehalococcoidia bacterium]|nr:globin [Dehalococcoidia bacterium]|tara:strand:+ start:1119 stop:1538 length:420 start_codon:yes stop_codon:yes gene_type:complete